MDLLNLKGKFNLFKKLRKIATLLLAFTTILILPASASTIGWNQSNHGYYYYINSNGDRIIDGWVYDNGNWYYLNSSGYLLSDSWIQNNDNWYHVDYNGAMETGWVYDRGNWYYFDSDGIMHTDWLYDGYNWYYFDTNGVWLH